MVWIGGAVFGWALMVVTVYNVLRFPGEQLAEDTSLVPPAAVATDEKSLNEIAPAAGGQISPAEAETPSPDMTADEADKEDEEEPGEEPPQG